MDDSRIETQLGNIAGTSSSAIPAPLSRIEKRLQKIIGTYDGDIEAPLSRIEELIDYIAEHRDTSECDSLEELNITNQIDAINGEVI